MASKPLTNAAQIAAAKSQDGREVEHRVSGVKGLVLRCYPSGEAAFWFYYRRVGKLRKVRIGARQAFDLREARKEAADLFARTERGDDPATEKAVKRTGLTFRELWERRAAVDQRLAPSTRTQNAKTLETHVMPYIGNVRADAVTHDQVRGIVDQVARVKGKREGAKRVRGGRRQADNVTTTVSATYRWGIAQRLVKANPAAGVPKVWAYVPRKRVIPAKDLGVLWSFLNTGGDKAKVGEPMRDLIAITLLTFCRRREATSARKAAVVDDVWTLAGDTTSKGERLRGDTKNGVAHSVPLSAQAAAIFSRAAERSGSDYFFPADPKRRKLGAAPRQPHLNLDSVNGAIDEITAGLGLAKFTPHDLRRTAATWAGENGIDDGVIKRLLNHVPDSRDITALAYNHAAKLDARREALQRWGDYLESLARR